MIVYIAEAYVDYEKNYIVGVYDTCQRARKQIHTVNGGSQNRNFNRYAIASWLVGETLPLYKLWLYPVGGTLFEQEDLLMPGNQLTAQRPLPDVSEGSAKGVGPHAA